MYSANTSGNGVDEIDSDTIDAIIDKMGMLIFQMSDNVRELTTQGGFMKTRRDTPNDYFLNMVSSLTGEIVGWETVCRIGDHLDLAMSSQV